MLGLPGEFWYLLTSIISLLPPYEKNFYFCLGQQCSQVKKQNKKTPYVTKTPSMNTLGHTVRLYQWDESESLKNIFGEALSCSWGCLFILSSSFHEQEARSGEAVFLFLFFLTYLFNFSCAGSSREGNGTPLQYSCLENPMNGGAWWAAVHGVAKSWTRLSNFTFTFHFHALEKEMATHSSVLAWRIPGTGEPGGLLSMGSHRVDTTEAT